MTWIPGIAVLLAGLVGGWLLARRLDTGGSRLAGRDLELKLTDLENRRDDLYRRLREIDTGLGPEQDRAPLERSAARTLREIEQLGGELSKKHPKVARQREEEDASGSAVKTPPSTAKVFISGFAYGAGLLVLIGGLIYWAVRDAKPREDDSMSPMAAPEAAEHPDLNQMPPQVESRVASILAHLGSQPDDLAARKELAYTYLGASQFLDAYRQGEEILARAPTDPDGFYIQGVVRLTMGQIPAAEQLLAQALESDPDHVDSLTAVGIVRLRLGDYPQAIELWKRGLSALGGSHPMMERMIRLAEAGRPPEEILGIQGPADPTLAEAGAAPSQTAAQGSQALPGSNAPPGSQAPPGSNAPQSSEDAFTVTIELARGATASPGSTLFVFLRGPTPGPPAAVRRISAPTFPLKVSLTQADSMLGRPLPVSGTLSARLDRDGSASTRDPGDLADEVEIEIGQAVSLALSPQP